jgi:outer membrane protein TolC
MSRVAKTFFFIGIAILFVNLSLHGQEVRVLTLKSCLEEARLNYPSIKAKQAEVFGQEKKLSASKTEYLPALLAGGQVNYATANSLNGAYISNEGLSTSISGGIHPQNNYNPVFGSFGTLEVDWKVFTFGKVAANVNTAKSALNSSQADYENEIFQHQVRVADAYLLALVTEKLSIAQENNLKRAQRLQEVIRAGALAGLKAGADSSFAAAEVSKAKLLFLESKKNELAQLIRLAELIGEKNDIRVDSAVFFSQLPLDFSTDTVHANQLPAVKYFHTLVNFRQSRSIAIRRSYAPSILLTGIGYARGSGISNKDNSYNESFSAGVPFQVYNYYAGISVRMNILNYAKVNREYKSELFEMEKAQHLYEEAELKADKQLELANIQLTLARQQADEAPLQFNAALASYRQSSARYRSGFGTIADLAQNFYILNRADVDKSISFNNVWRAVLIKAAAAGNLSYLTNQIN